MPFLPITRRKFFGIAATAGIAALGADSVLIEPNHPRIVQQEIALPRWPVQLNGFTIALLADFHYDPYFSVHPLEAAIGMVNGLRPDLIVLAGDFVSASTFGSDEKAAAAAEPCSEFLRRMRAQHGLWAVMGNHDVSTDRHRVTGALQAEGIQVLVNQSVPIESNGARFWLCGVDDVLDGSPDLAATLRDVPPNAASILVAHEPDYADYVAGFPVDLQLSGHTHGGQVRLPFLGPLYLPALAKRYIWGLYKIRDLTLYTNPGIGTVGIPVRWNCPPEITLLTLRNSAVS